DRDLRDVVPVVVGLRLDLDPVGGVEVEVAPGGDPVDVGLVEAGGDEERPVLVLLDEARHPPGGPAVGLVLVAIVRGRPRPLCGAGLLALLPGKRLPGLVARQVRRVLRQVPAELVLERAVVDLAHPGREVAVRVEVLLEGYRPRETLARRLEVVPHPRALGPPAGEERSARGAARGYLAVGPVEAPPLVGQAVDRRRL